MEYSPFFLTSALFSPLEISSHVIVISSCCVLSFYLVVLFKVFLLYIFIYMYIYICTYIIFIYFSGRTEVQSVLYGKEKANKERVFAR